jgi:hypothetical protein
MIESERETVTEAAIEIGVGSWIDSDNATDVESVTKKPEEKYDVRDKPMSPDRLGGRKRG